MPNEQQNEERGETESNNNNGNNNVGGGETPTGPIDNNTEVSDTPKTNATVGSVFNHDDLGMNVSKSVSKAKTLSIDTLLRQMSSQEPRMITEEELGNIVGDFVKVVAQVVYEAAASAVREVGFATDREDVLEGIRRGFSKIAEEQIYPEYGVFSVRLPFSVNRLSNFASSCSDLTGYEVSASKQDDYSSCIDLKKKSEEQTVTPEDDNWKEARHKFIGQFSNEQVWVCSSNLNIEKAGTLDDPALTWVVRTAGRGGEDPAEKGKFVSSAVRRLTIGLEPESRRDEMINHIAWGVNELLQQEDGLGLKNGFLKINVSFAQKSDWVNQDGSPKKISYYNNGEDHFTVKYLEDGNLLLYSKDLRGIVAERFEKGGDDYVWEEEVDILGLEDVLCLAASPKSNVGQLWLRTSNGNETFFVREHDAVRKQLVEALKYICEKMKDNINPDLLIKTNLNAKEAEDLNLDVNGDCDKNDYRDRGLIFADESGTICIGGRAQFQIERKKVLSYFQNEHQQEVLKKYFENHKEISWDDMFLGGNDAAFVESYREVFKNYHGDELKSEVISLAADAESACTKLILGRVAPGLAVDRIEEVLARSRSIHGFDLQVERAQEIYDYIMKNWKPEWKHKLKMDGDTLRIVNGVDEAESGATKTSTTGDAGKDERDAARKQLLERFRTQEIAHVCDNEYKLAGVAWAVKAAMTDPQSKVKELVLDIKSAGEDYNQIGVGIGEALHEGWSANNVFSIRVGFSVDVYNHLDGLIKSAGPGNEIVIWLGDRRIFVYGNGEAEKWLITSLNSRFATNDDSYVYEFELDLYDCLTEHMGTKAGEGLEEILRLAANPKSKVKTLYLRTDSGNGPFLVKKDEHVCENLEKVLKEICAMPKINADLQIKTNLDEKEAEDLNFDVNYDYINNKFRDGWRIFADEWGTIYIGGKTRMELKEVLSYFKDKTQQDGLKSYFASHNEISWNDLFDEDVSSGKYAPFASSYRDSFKECKGYLQSELIPLAAEQNSKVKTLILDNPFWLSSKIAVLNVLKQSGAIHGFELKSNNAQKIYDECIKNPEYKNLKHKLEMDGDTLRIVNGVNDTTPTTGGAGGADAGAKKKIDLEKIKSDLRNILNYAPADAKFRFEFLGDTCNMPLIYAYAYYNDIVKNNEKGPGEKDPKLPDVPLVDDCIVDEVLDPTEAGFPDCDLVLKATCYYKPGVYADRDAGRNDRTDTRNYFVHAWLKDTRSEKEIELFAKTEVQNDEGDVAYVSNDEGKFFGGELRSVVIHAINPETDSAFLSPDNCVFKAADKASAWFVTEFNPTDSQFNPKGVEFPDGVGKGKIAIHWTFVADDDMGTKGTAATSGSTQLTALPCLFSTNPDERSMDAVKVYLKWKKEKKEEKEKEDLKKIVSDRFEKGSDYVSEKEARILGLKDVLLLAAKLESKVKTLHLRTGSGNEPFFVEGRDHVRKELVEALKEICAMEKINAGLVIATDLRWKDGVGDLEDELNALSSRNAVMFGGSGGMISFAADGMFKTPAINDAITRWNSNGDGELVKAEFKKQSGDVDWDRVVEQALGSSEMLWLYFRQARLQTKSIGWAAELDSKVGKLILNEVFKFGLMYEIKKIVECETFHEFALSVIIKEGGGKDISLEDFLEDLKHRQWWQDRKSDMELKNGLFVFKSKNASGTGVPPTGTAGTGMADAGKIIRAARDGSVPELEIKSYSNENALILEILDALELNTEIHEFALKGNGIDDTLFRKITAGLRYAGCKHTLCKFEYDGKDESGNSVKKTGLYFMNGIYNDLGKADAAKLEDLRERLKTVGEDRSFVFARMSGFTCPIIFPYDSYNIIDRALYGSVLDHWIVTDVLDREECPEKVRNELGGDESKDSDLILEATCFYNPNLCAEVDAQVSGVETRNYFLHPWLADDLNDWEGRKGHKVEINLSAATKIIEPNGIAEEFEYESKGRTIKHADFDGRDRPVIFHDGDCYSPNNFIFKIEYSGADAWFVSSHTSKGGSMRRIVIHWTFVQDVGGSEFFTESLKRSGKNVLSVLPCQFSLNPNERSMDAVKVYLEWKKKKKEEKKEKEEKLLNALNAATNRASSFDLDKDTLNDNTFDKALDLGKEVWFKILNGTSMDVLEGFFKKRFVDGDKVFNGVALDADLSDDRLVDIWMAFKRKMDKAFGDKGKSVFINLDKKNNKIWFAVSDMDEKEKEALSTPLPPLQVDKGKLEWTDELKAWWRNPANKVETFAMALAETPGLAEVDFTELFESDSAAGLFSGFYDTDEWKAFRDDEVLHRYRKDDGVAAFYGCSGVTFTFVPGESYDAFKNAVENANCYDNTGAVDWKQPTWSVTVEDRYRAVEDKSKNRLLWNNAARKLLADALNAERNNEIGEAKETNALFLKFFEDADKALTLGNGQINCIDFTVVNASEMREVFESEAFWKALGSLKVDELTLVFSRAFFGNPGAFVRRFIELTPLGWHLKQEDRSGVSVIVATLKPANAGKFGDGTHYPKFKNNFDDRLPEIDVDPEKINPWKRWEMYRVSDADVQFFFGKSETSINLTEWVYVDRGAKIRDLTRKADYCGKFIACVKSTGIQKLGLDKWKPGGVDNIEKLKKLVMRVFRECSNVVTIAVGVKIIEDTDPNFDITEKNYTGSTNVYYEVTRK